LRIGLWIAGGVGLGSLLAGLQGHPRRALGLVPFGATGLLIGLMFAALGSSPSVGLCLFLGITAGLVNVPLSAGYQHNLPAAARRRPRPVSVCPPGPAAVDRQPYGVVRSALAGQGVAAPTDRDDDQPFLRLAGAALVFQARGPCHSRSGIGLSPGSARAIQSHF